MDTVEKCVTGVALCILCLMGYAVYKGSQEPAFSLRKDEWACTKSHQVMYMQMVGKVMIPQHRTVCDTWERV